jgi:adenosylcobyric acid synthase
MTARAIMILGTSSHVGKSLLTAALCRIFSDLGYRVAPFKSQNMSLNSAATVEGLEIGRAQALQAEAARVAPSVHMNPILLKPAGDMTSQIVVRGKIWGRLSAADYHQRRVPELLPLVQQSYDHLAATHDLILIEGAGSPAEINLKQNDIVNMRIADMADAACLLVGDIDRGGVFAALYGTVALLDPHEQDRIHGFLINKFRGDPALLTPGIRMIEDRLHKPCLGVVPHLDHLDLEEEDSLGLTPVYDAPWPDANSPDRPLRIAVVSLPSFSNFTDFDALRAEPSVSLRLCRTPAHLAGADLILLPGSKQTVDDLLWLRAHGLADTILAHAAHSLVVGICGGMQMLGRTILDPHAIEHEGTADGLALLPIDTVMNPAKRTQLTSGTLAPAVLFGQPIAPLPVTGYEIHIGETLYPATSQPFARLADTTPDGCISPDTRVFGTYLHGLFDDDPFRHAFLHAARAFHGLAAPTELQDWKQRREDSLDRLASAVRAAVDMPTLLHLAGEPLAQYQDQHS